MSTQKNTVRLNKTHLSDFQAPLGTFIMLLHYTRSTILPSLNIIDRIILTISV